MAEDREKNEEEVRLYRKMDCKPIIMMLLNVVSRIIWFLLHYSTGPLYGTMRKGCTLIVKKN